VRPLTLVYFTKSIIKKPKTFH